MDQILKKAEEKNHVLPYIIKKFNHLYIFTNYSKNKITHNQPVATVRLVLKALIVSFAFLNSNSKTERKETKVILNLICIIVIRIQNYVYIKI